MAEKYRVDKRIKLLWLLPYIILIFIMWLCLSLMFIFAKTSFPEFLQTHSVYLVCLVFLIILILIIGLPAYIWLNLKYKNLYYEIADNNFIIYKGVISKKQIVIPYNTLENINIKRSLIEQLIGLATLELDTAGSTDIEGTVPGITDPIYIMNIIKSKIVKKPDKIMKEDDNVLRDILKELRDIKYMIYNPRKVDKDSTFEKSKEPESNNDKTYDTKFSKLEELLKKKFEKKRKR